MSTIKTRVTKLEQRILDKSPIVLFTTYGNPADEERIAEAKRQAKAQGRPLKIWVRIYVDPEHNKGEMESLNETD
jgi:hypothetical protein